LYDQVFLYAERIKNIPRCASPICRKVISTPKMLRTFSPLASLLRHAGPSGKPTQSEEKGSKRTIQFSSEKKAKSTFSQAVNDEEEKADTAEDFTSAACNDGSPKANHVLINKVPSLKIESNDLTWMKEQKSSKDTSYFQKMHEGCVRDPNRKPKLSNKKLSSFATAATTEDQSSSSGVQPRTKSSNSECDEDERWESVLYCECGNACEGGKVLCPTCIKNQKTIDFAGYLFMDFDSSFKLFWFRLLNKELYCYNSKEDKDFTKLLRLSGVFVKQEANEQLFEGVKVFPFSLVMERTKRVFLAKSTEEREIWIQHIRSALGYSNLFAFYDIKVYLIE